jgi:protein-S-isoprenylcysteine O-methyltransferase Ste14
VAKKKQRSGVPDLSEALSRQEAPQMKWKAIAQIAGVIAVLWVTAGMLVPYVGYWALGAVGVLTLVAIGFGIYIWRLTTRSRAILDIMKGATDESGRQRAIEALSGDSGDVM